MPFHHKISSQAANLNQNENQILNYCLKNPETILNMKLTELSEVLFSSPATLVRFCKKLGFSGFSDFKSALKIEMESQNHLNESHSTDFLVDFKKTINFINETDIETLIDTIHKKNKIEFYAVGSSRMVANELTKKFQAIGKLSFCYDDSSLMNVSAKNLNKGDMIIALSVSGETELIINACLKAKTNGVAIASLTDLGNNTLSRISDIALYVTSTSFSKSDINIRSRAQLLMLSEYIFFRYIEKYYDQI